MSVKISDMGDEVFLDTMLTVGTTNTTLLYTGVEALHSLEVLTVDVGLTKLQFAACLYCNIQILGED